MKDGNNITSTLSESSMKATHFEAAVISILCYMAIRLMAKLYKKWRELRIWDFLCGMYEGFAKFMAADVECHVRPPADDTDDESDEPSYQMGSSGARIITINTATDNESDTEEEPPTQSPAENPKNPKNPQEGSEEAFKRKMKEIDRERRGYYKSGRICPDDREGIECTDDKCSAYHKSKRTLREFGKAPAALKRRVRCHDECKDERCSKWHPKNICRGLNQLCDEWHQNDLCRVRTPKQDRFILPGFYKGVKEIICTEDMCLDPECQRWHWNSLWIQTSKPYSKAPFLQRKECCDDELWMGHTCRDPTCRLRHKHPRPDLGVPMDPYWNIESVMNPPKLWNITRKGNNENTGRPVENKPPLAAEEPANGAPLSKEANPMGNANRVVSFNDQVGQGTAQNSLTDTKNTMEKSSFVSQPIKESCKGTPTNQTTNPPQVRLIITTTCSPTVRKTPLKHKHKPDGKKGSKKTRTDPHPKYNNYYKHRTKTEKNEALRKEREAKRLAKASKKAMKAEKKMAKKRKVPEEGATGEPCRIN